MRGTAIHGAGDSFDLEEIGGLGDGYLVAIGEAFKVDD